MVFGAAFCGAGEGLEAEGGGMVGSEVDVVVVCAGLDSGAGACEGAGSALGAYREEFRPLFAPPAPPRPPLCLRSCPSFRPFLCTGFPPLLWTFAAWAAGTEGTGVSSSVTVGSVTGSNSSAKRSSSSRDCANSSIASDSRRIQVLRLR